MISKKMRILLIVPSALGPHGRPIRQRRLHYPNLTLPMLAALTPPHVEVRLCNETVEEIPYDERWDLVGISSMGSGIVRAWQIGDAFRRRGSKVILGGVAVTLMGVETSIEHVDSVVIGEADEIWPGIVADFEAGRLKPVYRMKRRPPIDNLPVPRYDLIDRATLGIWRPVQASRGCPYPCTFCSVTAFYGGSFRKVPVEHVVRDVRAARRSGSRYIAFIDDNVGVDFEYSVKLWEALIPERIIWTSQCSLQLAGEPEMLDLAYRSGCRMLSFGLESMNRSNLDRIEKSWNHPACYREAIRNVRSRGIDFSSEMLLGLDDDDESVFQTTYDFIMENRINVPRVHVLTPVPGTPLWDELEAEDRITCEDFSRYSGADVVYRTRRIDPRRLEDGFWKLHERLFSWRSILHRIRRNEAALPPFFRAMILGVNLHYRDQTKKRIPPGMV